MEGARLEEEVLEEAESLGLGCLWVLGEWEAEHSGQRPALAGWLMVGSLAGSRAAAAAWGGG